MKNEKTGTEPHIAPATAAPRQLRIERQGQLSVPYTAYYPQVRGGLCEFCGVIDPNVPSEHQYKLCPHYRGMQLHCSYCEATKDPDQVIYHSVLNVHGHPNDPNSLVVVCNSYDCSKAHIERFKINK